MFFAKPKFNTISILSARESLAKDTSIILIDVRSNAEYNEGHIPNSINIPLDKADLIEKAVSDKQARLFVYCLSGARSRSACGAFTKLGYTDVTNIGGINAWQGKIERG
ncbi:MAG: rhodanese-like domain-containing protein [Oscillospiraceae bacterium]